jgi:hypothetical protein
MYQVKTLLDNLQMVDSSVIFIPYKAKDRAGVESDMIATEEHPHDNYDFMRKYFTQFYVNRFDMYMYINVSMAFKTHHKSICSGQVATFCIQVMYPRDLQVKKLSHCGIIYLLTQRYAGQTAFGSLVPLEWVPNDSTMESSGYKSVKREGASPPLSCEK